MGRRPMNPEKKAAVVAGLAAGATIQAVSRAEGVPEGTVGVIRANLKEEINNNLEKEERATFNESFVIHFHKYLDAMNRYAEHTSTQAYIASQPAGEMASLIDTASTHLYRLIDIAGRVGVATEPAIGEQ